MMELNPFLSVWTQPKETARQFIKNDKLGYTMILSCIAGIGTVIASLQNSGFFQDLSPAFLIFGILIAGIISGFLSLGLNALLYTFIGKLYGGHGRMRDMAVAMGPTVIPHTILVPVIIFYALYYGKLFFAAPADFNLTSIPFGADMILLLLSLIASIWSVVIASKTIGLVHGFSSWRGFGVYMTFIGLIVLFSLLLVIGILMFIF